jgi:hypothetical protein
MRILRKDSQSVAHTPSVREDLGSIPHPNPGWQFFQKLSSPFFQTTDFNDFIHL